MKWRGNMVVRSTQFGVLLMLLWFCPAHAAVFYVDVNSTNPAPPYANWNTAAMDIQSAVDASSDGDQILVNDGIYQTGGRVVYGLLTNRVVINKAVTVQSVNGPAAAVIQGNPLIGDSAVRCVYMTNGATLCGFTITNGATREFPANFEDSGGGVWCESTNILVTNCVLSGNIASGEGGGTYGGTLMASVLSSNSADGTGGGAMAATLINCVISNNNGNAGGGGVAGCLVNDCVIVNNTSSYGGGADFSVLNNCTLAGNSAGQGLSLIHISEPTRLGMISYAVFCLKKKK